MSRKASTVFAAAALAGIAATAMTSAARRITRPGAVVSGPPVPGHRPAWELPETRTDRVVQIIANVMIAVALTSLTFLMFVPAAARAMPASNAEIRSHYGIDVVDNPEFTGGTFLKRGDDHLAYVCGRPSVGDAIASKDLSCRLP